MNNVKNNPVREIVSFISANAQISNALSLHPLFYAKVPPLITLLLNQISETPLHNTQKLNPIFEKLAKPHTIHIWIAIVFQKAVVQKNSILLHFLARLTNATIPLEKRQGELANWVEIAPHFLEHKISYEEAIFEGNGSELDQMKILKVTATITQYLIREGIQKKDPSIFSLLPKTQESYQAISSQIQEALVLNAVNYSEFLQKTYLTFPAIFTPDFVQALQKKAHSKNGITPFLENYFPEVLRQKGPSRFCLVS